MDNIDWCGDIDNFEYYLERVCCECVSEIGHV